MALNALVDSFLPQSEKVWDWKGWLPDLCRHSLVVMVFLSMSRQIGHISSLCRLRGDTAISVLSVITSWGVLCSSYKLNSHVLFDIGACSIAAADNIAFTVSKPTSHRAVTSAAIINYDRHSHQMNNGDEQENINKENLSRMWKERSSRSFLHVKYRLKLDWNLMKNTPLLLSSNPLKISKSSIKSPLS